MVNISQTFVTYNGCGNGYLDGTRKLVPKNRKLNSYSLSVLEKANQCL